MTRGAHTTGSCLQGKPGHFKDLLLGGLCPKFEFDLLCEVSLNLSRQNAVTVITWLGVCFLSSLHTALFEDTVSHVCTSKHRVRARECLLNGPRWMAQLNEALLPTSATYKPDESSL